MAICHAAAGEIVDLRPLGNDLKQARTTAIIKTETFEAVRLIVREGATIAPHQVPGPIMLHCLEGQVLLGITGSDVELSAGQWICLDGGERHSLRGIRDSSLLLTILFAGEQRAMRTAGTSEQARSVKPTAVPAADQDSDALLNEGLIGTFPASDPVATGNPSMRIRIAARHLRRE
jgi:quercetin dioxygenase-like cupin family protein